MEFTTGAALLVVAAAPALAGGFAAGEKQFLYRELVRVKKDVDELVFAVQRERRAGGDRSDVVSHGTSGWNAWRLAAPWRAGFTAHLALLPPLTAKLDLLTDGFTFEGKKYAFAELVSDVDALMGRIDLDAGEATPKHVQHALRKLDERLTFRLVNRLGAVLSAVGRRVPEARAVEAAEGGLIVAHRAAKGPATKPLAIWLARTRKDLDGLARDAARTRTGGSDTLDDQVLVHDTSFANQWYLQEHYRLGLEGLATALDPFMKRLDEKGPAARRGADPKFRFAELPDRLRALRSSLKMDLGQPNRSSMLKALRWLEEQGVPAARKSLETVAACVREQLPDLDEVEVMEGLRAPVAQAAAEQPPVGFGDLNAAPEPVPNLD